MHEVRDFLDATIVMIDHDIHVMRDLVGRLYVLAAGQVIAEGPPSVLETDAAVRDVHRRRLRQTFMSRSVAGPGD